VMEQTNVSNSTEQYLSRTVENTSIEKLIQLYANQLVIRQLLEETFHILKTYLPVITE